MSSPFAITVAASTVFLDTNRQGQISFTVSNTTTRTTRTHARVVPLSSLAGSWLTLQGEAEQELAGVGSQQYTIQIVVPSAATPGDYTFRLDVVDAIHPDEDFSQGPAVKFVVPAPLAVKKKPFPWWIVAVIVGALALIGGSAYGIAQVAHKTAVAAMPALAATTVVTGQWQSVASMPMARGGLVVVRGPDGRFYAIGGYGSTAFGSSYLSTVEIYDPKTNAWTTGAPMPTRRGYMAATLGPDGLIYVIGGSNRAGDSGLSWLNTVEAYDPATNSWTTVASVSIPRYGLAAVTGSDGLIYAIGGNSGGVDNTVEAYNSQTHSWASVAPLPTARSGLAAVQGSDGRIYAIGGQGSKGNSLNTVEAYDPKTNSWASVAPLPTARSGLAAVQGSDGRIYAIGGKDSQGNSLNTVEAYDPKTNSWTTVVSLPTTRYDLGVALGLDGRIYTVGGFTGGSNFVNNVEAYVL